MSDTTLRKMTNSSLILEHYGPYPDISQHTLHPACMHHARDHAIITRMWNYSSQPANKTQLASSGKPPTFADAVNNPILTGLLTRARPCAVGTPV
jgi:hypothetical protein